MRNPIKNIEFRIKNSFRVLLLCSCLFTLGSCTDKPKQKPIEVDAQKLKEDIVNINKPPVVMELDEINAYIKSHGYTMQSTGTGLRYMIVKKTEKKGEIKTGNIIKVKYKVSRAPFFSV